MLAVNLRKYRLMKLSILLEFAFPIPKKLARCQSSNLKIPKLPIYIWLSRRPFIFKNKTNNQIDGVAMDSRLASVLANIFMWDFDEKRLFGEYFLIG